MNSFHSGGETPCFITGQITQFQRLVFFVMLLFQLYCNLMVPIFLYMSTTEYAINIHYKLRERIQIGNSFRRNILLLHL